MSSTTPGQRQSYQQQQQQLGSSEREEGSSNDGGIHVKRESHESDVRGRRVASGDRGSAAQAPTERGHRRRAELPETIRTFLNRPDEVARDDVRTIINNFEKTQLVELLAHASTLSKEVRDALRAVVGSNATFRRLLVRNISFQSSSDTVKNALGKFGIIEEGTVVYDRHTGRSKGFAFVTFERVESACEAVSCSNQGKIYLDGRQLILKFAADKIDHDQQMGVVQATHSGSERDKSAEISVSTMGGGGRTAVVRASADDTGNKSGTYSNQSMRKLFVYNLAPYTTSVTLREVFGKYGPMDECIVVYDSAGKSKRYAFVTYSNVEDAWACLEEPHKTVDGRMTFTHLASEGSSSNGGGAGTSGTSGDYGNRRSRSNFAGTTRPTVRGHSPTAGRGGGTPRDGSLGGGERTSGSKGSRKGYSSGPPPQAAAQVGSILKSQQQQEQSPMMDSSARRNDQSPLGRQARHQMVDVSGIPNQSQQDVPRGYPFATTSSTNQTWGPGPSFSSPSVGSGADTPSTHFSPTQPGFTTSPWCPPMVNESSEYARRQESMRSPLHSLGLSHGSQYHQEVYAMSPFPPVASPGPVGPSTSSSVTQQGRYCSEAPNTWGPRTKF